MKRIHKCAFILLLACGAATAQTIKIAVADFSVTSDNAAIRFVGKGLTEMVSGELSRIAGVSVIERGKRAKILEELEFAMSDAASGKGGPEAGSLLAADYILYGEIIDMSGSILLSAKLVSVETGEIAWADEKLGELAGYSVLSESIARGAAGSRGLDGSAKRVAGGESTASARKGESALLAFSAAVDALDHSDMREAKKQIELAAKADPNNAAVGEFYARIASPAPRHHAEVEFYTPLENPADAALSDRGSIGLWCGSILGVSDSRWGKFISQDLSMGGRLTLSLPAGKNWSVQADALTGARAGSIWTDDGSDAILGTDRATLGVGFYGGSLGFGFRVKDGFSIGATALAYSTFDMAERLQDGTMVQSEYGTLGLLGTEYGASASCAFRNPASTIFASFQASWTTIPSLYVSVPDKNAEGMLTVSYMPIVAEASVMGRIPGKRAFAGLRGILEQDIDPRASSFIRLLPGCEFWPAECLGLRASLEINAYRGAAPLSLGWGGLLGASLMAGDFEISLNASLSSRHSRFIPESEGSNEPFTSYLLGVSRNDFGRR